MNKFWHRIKKPNIPLVVFTVILFMALLALSLFCVIKSIKEFWVYIVYALSALALGYFVYVICYVAKHARKGFRAFAMRHKYTKKYLEDFQFKSLVSLILSFLFDVFYALMQGVFAILGKSFWYGALSIYYMVLCLIRGGIVYKSVKYSKLDNETKIQMAKAKSYRNCGIYLLILICTLSGAIVQIVLHEQGYKYAGFMIYAMAFYVFYKFIYSIVKIFKAKRKKDLTTQSIINLNLSDSLVSLLALQTAMFQAFDSGVNNSMFNAITGGGVVVILIIMSSLMIYRGQKLLKNKESERE